MSWILWNRQCAIETLEVREKYNPGREFLFECRERIAGEG